MPKHFLVPENVINEFVSKVTKHGDKVTAILKSEKETKSKKLVCEIVDNTTRNIK